ncbi:hypothetical protein [Neomegalonema perideroedes]|uniref:hypothetical protein n=1 Tax=Neomegalonema perideroedes TaxID=217219 RepID=UPI0012FD7D42|nr:hypothetical protein [Neomegalonema perideroedes]
MRQPRQPRLFARVFASLFALGAAAFAAPQEAEAAVWTATNQWDENWERRYESWVRDAFHKDYFHNSADRLTFGLELDCADAIYTMRILFAHENSLPFAINAPGGKGVLSNDMTRWDNYRPTLREEQDDGTWTTYQGPAYDETQKLRAFIEHVNDATVTWSLVNDTYPVALSEVRPGDIYLIPGTHAYIVKEVAPTGAMTTLSASSPRAWRPMAVVDNFPSEVPKDASNRDGYRRFKPEAHLRTAPARVPGASLEQWSVAKSVGGDWSAFAMATQEALAKIQETFPQKADRLFGTLCNYAIQRVDVVNIALDALRRKQENHGSSCFGAGEYGEFSTPTRDAKLAGHFRVLQTLTQDPQWAAQDFPAKRAIQSIFTRGGGAMGDEEMLAACAVPFDYMGGRRMDLRQLREAIDAKRVASDPHAPLDYRWGVAQQAWRPTCPSARGS